MPDKHALLSASSAHRWLHCPPSARLCENYEDKGSDYAAEGTDAHSLCEYKLRKALGMEAHDPTEDLSFFNQEMDLLAPLIPNCALQPSTMAVFCLPSEFASIA